MAATAWRRRARGSRIDGVDRRARPGRAGLRACSLTATPTLQAGRATAAAARCRATLRIAALNLENLFNGDGHGGGFPDAARRAHAAAELAAQLAKHVATLDGLDADVVALMELENDGYGPDSSLAALVAALNAGGGDWRFVDAGQGPGDNAIRVGLIYRATACAPSGKPAIAGRRARSARTAACRWRRPSCR